MRCIAKTRLAGNQRLRSGGQATILPPNSGVKNINKNIKNPVCTVNLGIQTGFKMQRFIFYSPIICNAWDFPSAPINNRRKHRGTARAWWEFRWGDRVCLFRNENSRPVSNWGILPGPFGSDPDPPAGPVSYNTSSPHVYLPSVCLYLLCHIFKMTIDKYNRML